jgi:hypothetical protein
MAPEVRDPKKLLKIVNYQKHVLGQLEKVGGHRYPLDEREVESGKYIMIALGAVLF